MDTTYKLGETVKWNNWHSPCQSGQCVGIVTIGTWEDNLGELVVFWTDQCERHVCHKGTQSDPIETFRASISK